MKPAVLSNENAGLIACFNVYGLIGRQFTE